MVTLRYSSLLGRADDQTLQELLGVEAVRLIQRIEPAASGPARLRRLVEELTPALELLRKPDLRRLLFDLLRQDEAAQLADILGWDGGGSPYAHLQEVQISKRSARERSLLDYLMLPSAQDEPPPPVPTVEPCTPLRPLFTHQRRALNALGQKLGRPPFRAVLHMPTGSGKTCEQAVGEFWSTWNAVGDREVTVSRAWGTHSLDNVNLADGLVVCGLAKLFNAARTSIESITRLRDRASLVVMDEAHQAIAPTYAVVLDALLRIAPPTPLVGLTATPGRSWDEVDEDRRLSAFFGEQKVGLEVEGYNNPVSYLIDEGYLARTSFEQMAVPSDPLTAAEQRDLEEAFDVPASLLRKLAADEVRTLQILHRAEELALRHRRILLFATTADHAELTAKVLRVRGLDALSVTYATPTSHRRVIIDRFRSDDSKGPMILCNYGVLTTGFDAPRTSAALIARPTKSLVLYSQMVGRAVRGPRAGGNAEAEVVTAVDLSLPGFGDISEAFMNWEDAWTR